MNEIKKVLCHNCGFEQVTDDVGLSYYETNSFAEFLCEECNSAVAVSEDLTAEEIINYIEGELENANQHSMLDVPQDIFDNVRDEFVLDEEQAVKLARILSESFEKLY